MEPKLFNPDAYTGGVERKGQPVLWYSFAAVLVIVTVACLAIFGGAPGNPHD